MALKLVGGRVTSRVGKKLAQGPSRRARVCVLQDAAYCTHTNTNTSRTSGSSDRMAAAATQARGVMMRQSRGAGLASGLATMASPLRCSESTRGGGLAPVDKHAAARPCRAAGGTLSPLTGGALEERAPPVRDRRRAHLLPLSRGAGSAPWPWPSIASRCPRSGSAGSTRAAPREGLRALRSHSSD